VSISRLLGRPIFATIALLSTGAMIAGCAGAQSGMTPQASTQIGPQSRAPFVPDSSCKHHGNLKVSPCSVTLTVSSPTATVTVKVPKKNTISEMDNCGGASGMATVVVNPSNPDQYVVTAGATTGSCTATFTGTNKHGKPQGSAQLSINNTV
jgi:hypothetical protein